MKRMIISSVIMFIDGIGLFKTIYDYQAFLRTPVVEALPQSNPANDFF